MKVLNNDKIKIQVISTLGWCSHVMKMRKLLKSRIHGPLNLSGKTHGHCPAGLWVVQTTLLNCLAAHICVKTLHAGVCSIKVLSLAKRNQQALFSWETDVGLRTMHMDKAFSFITLADAWDS